MAQFIQHLPPALPARLGVACLQSRSLLIQCNAGEMKNNVMPLSGPNGLLLYCLGFTSFNSFSHFAPVKILPSILAVILGIVADLPIVDGIIRPSFPNQLPDGAN